VLTPFSNRTWEMNPGFCHDMMNMKYSHMNFQRVQTMAASLITMLFKRQLTSLMAGSTDSTEEVSQGSEVQTTIPRVGEQR
jgi:hypothetical protein